MIPIILAGGAGTRLWPVSRQTMPKQFIALAGDGVSTFQATLRRVSGPGFGAPIVVTSADFRFVVAEQMQAIGIAGDIVLEPAQGGSALAAAVGALLAVRRDREAICLVLPADLVVSDEARFSADCLDAAKAAGRGRIVTLAIAPSHASSAYGYVGLGEPLGSGSAFALGGVVADPGADDAARCLADGFWWNSGHVAFPAELLLDELDAHASHTVPAARAAIDGGQRDLDFLRLDPAAFATAPPVSLDDAVIGRTERSAVLKAGFAGSRIGSWDSIYEMRTPDGNGNVVEGPVSTIDTHDSLVRSSGVLTAVVGLDDVVVVSTPDAVLVSSRGKTDKVRDLVAQLQAEGHGEAVNHLRMHRPWGWYQRIDVGDRWQVKHICVKPNGVLSLQRHYHRAEHWVVVHGTAEVTIDDTVELYHENEAAYLPIGCVHRLRNPGKIDLKIIEVQVGSYTGEDDIVRLDDVYARA